MLPETLLHYRVLRPLGSGGMGDVYLAEDTKLGRRVALKVLPRTHVEDPERRQRFEREAKAVAALNHPNIVTIHAVEQDGDVTFLTMELVDGRTLSQVIPKDGLPIDQLLKLAIPLADAVAAAHERGITHRDLKPANVMVTTEGRVKVLDFGLARLTESTDRNDAALTALQSEPLTGEGRIVGTFSYMSPEQAEGRPLDHRSDLFSLGVVLYEMATGERPFKGDTNVSVLSAILKDSPRSLSEIKPSLPRDLARIVKRALVKDPDHRYQTAKDIRNDLETLKEDLDSGTAEAAAVAPAAVRPARKRMSLGLALAAIAVVLIAGGAWYVWRIIGARTGSTAVERPFENVRLTRLTNTGNVFLAAISADGRYAVNVVTQSGKQSLWLRQVATNSNVQIVAPADVRYDGVSFSPDGNFVYYVVYPSVQSYSTVYQVPVLGGPPRKIIDDVDTPLAFSPDGKQFAFVRGIQRRGEAALMIAAADGTGERALVVHQNPLSFLLNNVGWSPDGSTLISIQRADTQGRAKLVAVNATTGREAALGNRVWTRVESVAWMPDGRGVVAAAQEDTPGAATQIWHLSYPQGEARRITNDLNDYVQVSVSADAGTIGAVQREALAHLFVSPLGDIARARQITTGTGRIDGIRGLAWTRDNRLVFASNTSGNSDIWIVDVSGANPRQLTVDPADDTAPQVTPDGRTIVFSSTRAGASIWQMDLDGGNQRAVLTAAGVVTALVSPDSKWLYYTTATSARRESWRMPFGGGTPERLTAHWAGMGIPDEGVFYHPTLWLIDLSPDGTKCLGFYADEEKRGWRVGIFPIGGGVPTRLDMPIPAAAFTPDGRALIYVDVRGGIAGLYSQPVTGGPSTQLATFPPSENLGNFALSPDGKQVAVARGTTTSDVVLIRRER